MSLSSITLASPSLPRCKDPSDAGSKIVYFRCFRSRSGVACHIGYIVPHQLTPRHQSRHLPFSLLARISFAFTHPRLSSPWTAVDTKPFARRSQPLEDRRRVPAPRAAFVLQHPVSVASPIKTHSFEAVKSLPRPPRCFVFSRAASALSLASAPALLFLLLSCVILSRPSLFTILVCPYIFTASFYLDAWFLLLVSAPISH
ncbi:hypothetical protein EDB83DRAFT_1737720 [Lactarius deliciosus]|nr:hypothetical protein EDB83DRAFT_1737720 [Lactarius deliciosus]